MCPIGFLMLSSTLQDLPSDSPAHADQPAARGEPRCAPESLPTNDPRVHPACPGRPRGRAGHCPTTSRRRRPGPNRRLGWPSSACASSRRGADSGRRRAGHGRSGRPRRPRPSQPYCCLPTPRSRTSLRPDTAHAATHRHRTPTPDAGQRTPRRSDARTGHWTPVPWTGKVDTGRSHRTPDAGRGRGQGDEGAAGIRTSWATTPSDRALGRPTVFLWTALAVLDSPCRQARR
jgi:hypothetical protein